MTPIYCCFYTAGTFYEKEAERLIETLRRHNLEHYAEPITDLGSWRANTGFTASFLLSLLDRFPHRPVVYLDADAFVWSYPALFDTLPETGADIAAHYRGTEGELLNGTLWLSGSRGCRLICETYRDKVKAGRNAHNEQRCLQEAITELCPDFATVYKLPPSYAWIHDIMANDLNGEEPVIEHLQASRQAHNNGALPARLRRIAQIEAR